jgi:hypothetical protein
MYGSIRRFIKYKAFRQTRACKAMPSAPFKSRLEPRAKYHAEGAPAIRFYTFLIPDACKIAGPL